MSTPNAAAGLDRERLGSYVTGVWEQEIVPQITEYIRIPCKSPLFDPDWAAHGHLDRAVAWIEAWCRTREIPGLQIEVVRLEGRTPVLFMEIPGDGIPDDSEDTVLLYGHLDKQPEMSGWREGLGPWTPVREGDRLYGRGGADDGYAAYASLTAIDAVRRHGGRHARCVVLIEACEESGSFDLPFYIDALAERIGSPSLVVCLDSGCGNYEQLWLTTSLRGIVVGTLQVDILREGVHSGDAGGVVPSSFRIARRLLSRIEDERSGRILLEALHTPIPPERTAQAREAAEVLGTSVSGKFPFVDGAGPSREDAAELVLDRTWRPSLAVTGQAGLPELAMAGNVLRPGPALKLSVRVPPSCDAAAAARALQKVLERDPPYGAQVTFTADAPGDGWEAPAIAPWLRRAVDEASGAWFGRPAVLMGEGGSIPFMGMLGARFPEAQFLITGVLGPGSNAHGPNEFLHIPMGTKLTCCVADVLDAHARRGDGA
jgi:acetylornithine deacetylase/succinyl-diaminopimelate desuccinylase-like protein